MLGSQIAIPRSKRGSTSDGLSDDSSERRAVATEIIPTLCLLPYITHMISVVASSGFGKNTSSFCVMLSGQASTACDGRGTLRWVGWNVRLTGGSLLSGSNDMTV